MLTTMSIGPNGEPTWDNREWRFYVFSSDDEKNATLVEETQSVMRQHVLA